MKGILLAGGHGTRLGPLTGAISKQLLPVYNKPMIYYPLSVLMLAGVREVLVISTPAHLPLFRAVLGDGSAWGMALEYVEQPEPKGLAQAFLLKPDFHAGQPTCLVLGDNLIYGSGLRNTLRDATERVSRSSGPLFEQFEHFEQSEQSEAGAGSASGGAGGEQTEVSAAGGGGAVVFGYPVKDPRRYGVVEFDGAGRAVSLEEKPEKPRSHFAVPGLYFYDASVTERAAKLAPSARGELEITDLNRTFLDEGKLHVKVWGRGTAWLDAGTHESLLEAQTFVRTIEERQGTMIACPEEIAFRQGWIDSASLRRSGEAIKSEYGDYLRTVADQAEGVPVSGAWT